MGLYKTLPDRIREVDVIIAGGGTAGCIIASRLASADTSLSVLVIEHGPNNYQVPSMQHIGLFFDHLFPDSPNTLFYPSKTPEKIGGRDVIIPSGGVLGGGSSINMCMYSRGQRSDFDDWNMPGWSADEVLPYMKKLETYHGKGDKSLHGYDGPIQVSDGTHRALKAENDFIQAAQNAGWKEVEDLQSMSAISAVARTHRYVTPEGLRQDTATTYLHPRLQDGKHPNLHVLVESQVFRVATENGVASGVIYRPNPKFQQGDLAETFVAARKMVIVSCGAIGTPLVLERSGIGKSDVLARAGVAQVVANGGVGMSYYDHQLMSYAYRTNLEKGDTINDIPFGLSTSEGRIQSNDRTLGYNGQDCGGKFRPTDEEAAAMGPEFLEAWNLHYKSKPDKPIFGMGFINTMPGFPPPGVTYGEYLGTTCFTLYPFSSGHVHITGPSIEDPPDFQNGFLSDPKNLDMKKHIWAYKTQREIMRRMQCYRGELAEWHPPFPANSNAAPTMVDSHDPQKVSKIEYSAEDEAVLEKYIKQKVDTTWHSMGTCKMAPKEKGGAVDESLNVYGVSKLKIADLSIAPGNVGANTNNTALMIGEKAADILIKELGL